MFVAAPALRWPCCPGGSAANRRAYLGRAPLVVYVAWGPDAAVVAGHLGPQQLGVAGCGHVVVQGVAHLGRRVQERRASISCLEIDTIAFTFRLCSWVAHGDWLAEREQTDSGGGGLGSPCPGSPAGSIRPRPRCVRLTTPMDRTGGN